MYPKKILMGLIFFPLGDGNSNIFYKKTNSCYITNYLKKKQELIC